MEKLKVLKYIFKKCPLFFVLCLIWCLIIISLIVKVIREMNLI